MVFHTLWEYLTVCNNSSVTNHDSVVALQISTTKKPFPSLAPLTVITLAALLAVGLAVFSVAVAMRGPWLGIEFDRDHAGDGIRIVQVVPDGPAAGKLKTGDIIISFESEGCGPVRVSPIATMEDPDYSTSYAQYNAFLEMQQKLALVIRAHSLLVTLSDGRQVSLVPENMPGLSSLSATLWWLLFFGASSFLLGIGVWSLHSSDRVTRVLAISGMGFMIAAYSCGIYVARELAMPGRHFFALVSISHLGLVFFAYAAILTFWYYPKKLGNAPAAWLFAVWGLAVWLNETLQWRTWPAHPFYAHLVVAYCLLVLFTFMQWQKSRGSPLERAMLRWMLATMSVTLGLNVLLFCLPIILTGKPVTTTSLTFGSVFVFYLGLIVGNIRYKQFDLEHWWFRAWKWMLFVLAALSADALFVYLLQLNHATSLGLTIALGTLYLLLRQWFWHKYSGKQRRALDHALPHLINALTLGQMKVAAEQQWKLLVERVFNPLSIKSLAGGIAEASIERSGLVLRLPALDNMTSLEIFCCDHGQRLFTSRDINLSIQLLNLMRQSRNMYDAHEQGVQQERIRIQRDLHDDVAARLLTLIHQPSDPVVSKVASSAMRGLREVIQLLGAEESTMDELLNDIESVAREQLAGLPVQLEWRTIVEKWPDILLNSPCQINLRRIVRETIANALKHSQSQHFVMDITYENGMLRMCLCSDGNSVDPSVWVPGRGLNNIRSRIAEMGGSHKWVIEQREDGRRYCCLDALIPLANDAKI